MATLVNLSGITAINFLTDPSSVSVSDGVIDLDVAGGGGVTTTGSPANGNLTKFSGASTITNGDLSGDVTTSGTLATTVAKLQGDTLTLAGRLPNQVIAWSGSAWVPANISALPNADASKLQGKNISAVAAIRGDQYTFDGTTWNAQSPSGAQRQAGHVFDGVGTSNTNFTNIGTTSNCIVSSTFTLAAAGASSTEPPLLKIGCSNTGVTQSRGYEDLSTVNKSLGSLPTLNSALFRIRANQTTNSRIWITLYTEGTQAVGTSRFATDTPNENYIGFRFSSGAANWFACCGTATASQTATDTGVPPDTTNSQLFEIKYDGTQLTYYINGALVATNTTNIPASSFLINQGVFVDNKNTANTATFEFGQAYMFLSK